MNIAVTGADGFLGYHLRCHALKFKQYNFTFLSRSDFQDEKNLALKLHDADVVIHLAGINRGTDTEVYQGNIDLVEHLLKSLENLTAKPQIIFASTTHIEGNSKYGQAKKMCSQILNEFCKSNEALFSELIIPHVFGEFCKPMYNSVTATFCHQIVQSIQPVVQQNSNLELIHVSDVVKNIFNVIENKVSGKIKLVGEKLTVQELLEKLEIFYKKYKTGLIPCFTNQSDLNLFNTLRSYMFPENYPFSLKKNVDNRGFLFEAVKTDHGGQGFLSWTHPQITRGQHYHYHKIERFCVLKGHATIKIRKLFSDQVHEFKVSGEDPCFIDMPTLHTHSITNTGSDDLLTLFWSHEIFNPDNSDTFAEVV